MSSASAVAAMTVLGGALGLDTTAALQLMLSEPLVAGTLAGLVLGDPALGLALGAALQLVWSGALPVGAAPFPDSGPAAVGGVGGAFVLTRAGVPAATAVAAGLVVALCAGMAGQSLTTWLRRRNDGLAAIARRGPRRGDAGGVRTAVVLGLAAALRDGGRRLRWRRWPCFSRCRVLSPRFRRAGRSRRFFWVAPLAACVAVMAARCRLERWLLGAGLGGRLRDQWACLRGTRWLVRPGTRVEGRGGRDEGRRSSRARSCSSRCGTGARCRASGSATRCCRCFACSASTSPGGRRSSQRHLGFFNTNPVLASYVLGAAAAAELRDRTRAGPAEARELKRALSGPLGMAGDALFWAALRPLAGFLGVLAALAGEAVGRRRCSLSCTTSPTCPFASAGSSRGRRRGRGRQGGARSGCEESGHGAPRRVLVRRRARGRSVARARPVVPGALLAAGGLFVAGIVALRVRVRSAPSPRARSRSARCSA